MTNPGPHPTANKKVSSSRAIAFACGAVVVGMVGLAYASVPLYNLFCKVTGFGGTPQVAESASETQGSRVTAVRFDANVAPGLPWRFEPEVSEINVQSGKTATVMYKITNLASRPVIGMATFNVQPALMGQYFNKLECFCFSEMELKPGETVEVPVVFFIDPKMENDSDLKTLKEMTLSYTFFQAKGGKPVAAAKRNTVPN